MANTKSTPSSRYIAAKALCQLYKEKQAIKPTLEGLCTQAHLSSAERGLAMNLCFGVIRNRQSIDQIIRNLSSVRLKKLDPYLHQALAVGIYQLFFLDGIPESAAVNEAVKSCQKAKVAKRLHGFVNAILRNAIRKRDFFEKKLETDKNEVMNHPEWMVKRWINNYGQEETHRICSINGSEPLLCLRIQKSLISRDNFAGLLQKEDIEYSFGIAPESILLPSYRGSIAQIPGFEKGFFQIQDQAAQLASHLLSPFSTGAYLDCCAGLGGKTGHIIDLIDDTSSIVALEPEKARAIKFEENMSRLFPEKEITLQQTTVQNFALDCNTRFAGIFVDAPCSGTGVIRRQPDIRWNRNPEDFICNQDLQLEILSCAAKLLDKEGVLVYATCSIEPEEDVQVIEKFLEQNVDFSLVPCAPFLPAEAHQHIIKHGKGEFFAPLPSAEIDGFFAARLVRCK